MSGGALEQKRDEPKLRRSPYVVAIAGTIFVLYTVLTIGDYQFKAIARAAYPDRDSLAQFMGTFYGAVGLVGLFVQFVVTPRMLDRFGVLGGAATMPVAFVTSSALLLAFPSVAVAAVLKASDHALQFSIFDATLQLLLFPFPAAQRERVRALVFAIMKPLGYAIGAVLLVIFAPTVAPGLDPSVAVARLGWISLPLGLLILPMLFAVRRGYVESMRGTLMRGKLVEERAAPRGGRLGHALVAALESTDAPQVLFAMDRLWNLDPDRLHAALPALATHPSPRVRAAALHHTRSLPHLTAVTFARERLEDPDPEVRSLAVGMLAHALGEDAHDELVALASRNDDSLRTAAIASLLRHGGLDGMLDGAPRLRALLDSDRAADRVIAARVLGLVGQPSLARAVGRLLADEDPAVRKAALAAAATVAAPRLMPLLVEALGSHALGKAASSAIVTLGDRAIPRLVEVLSDPNTEANVRLAVPRVLSRISTTAALAALLDRVDEPDDRVRQKILASASRLRLALGAPPSPLEPIRERIEREALAHEKTRDVWLRVRPRLARPLSDAHMRVRLRKGLIRILRLCELVYPREVVAGVRTHVFGRDRSLRANAFEVLESLLDRQQGARLLGLFDRYLELAEAWPHDAASPSAEDLRAFVSTEIGSGDPFRAALVLEAIAMNRVVICGREALAAMSDPDPLVREAAAIAVVETHASPPPDALHALVHDPDPVVARWAAYWASTGKSGIELGDGMYTTIEKVLFLQRVPILAPIAGEELVGLARTSEVLDLPRGEVVFRQGDPGAALYFVISGEVSLRLEGKEVSRRGPNDVFGEISIFEQEPRAVTAVVAEPAELLRVSADDFIAAAHDTTEIAIGVIRVLSRKVRESDQRLTLAQEELAALRKIAGTEERDGQTHDEAKAHRRGWDDDE